MAGHEYVAVHLDIPYRDICIGILLLHVGYPHQIVGGKC